METFTPLSVYSTGIYGRLSVLDNGKQDGDSIDSQIALLEQFVADRPYLALADRFIDNGYTGTCFERPEWDRLMAAVKKGLINCIVVKDLSRLGRNYIETGQLLEKVFPYLGVRFISINDGYDSAALNSTDELSASLKNIVNDYYAKDISRKACTALKAKRQRGDYIGSYAPYGYLKDPENKNHLIVDPRTAPTVRQIYQWRAEGMGYTTLLRKLNNLDTPSPGRYRFENGIVTNNNKRGSALLWSRHVLSDILRNIVYLGHLAQGKSSASLYRGIAFHRTTEDKWDVVYDTHEAIVDEDLFNRVQALNHARAAAYKEVCGKYEHLPKGDNPYGRRLVCADCGTVLKLYRNIYKGGKKACFTYICPTYEERQERACAARKAMRSTLLDDAVLSTLQKQMDLFLDAHRVLETILNQKGPSPGPGAAEKDVLDELQKQLKRKRSLFTSLYTDYREGILTKDEFTFAKNKYQSELDALERQIAETSDSPSHVENFVPAARKWTAEIERYRHAGTITRELVETFIQEIRMSADNAITVRLSFENEYAALLDACERLRLEVA